MEEKKDDQKPEKASGVDGEFFHAPGGKKIYDAGEPVVKKMERERAVFDRDLFFQELFNDFLISVQMNMERQRPNSKIITRWDLHTSFEDFCNDSLETIDRKIEAVKFAKAVKPHKISATDGDFFMSEAKIDPGSAAVTKPFGNEDYDALYEILRRARETILDYKAGRISLVINEKTGRVRITNPVSI